MSATNFLNKTVKGKKNSYKNEQLYRINQKKQHLNHISTTFKLYI